MIDILFLTCNRLEYTKASLKALVENTDWGLVKGLWVYDDGSTDGTREYLKSMSGMLRGVTKVLFILPVTMSGPVAVMKDFLTLGNTLGEYFAKVDNDLIVCPGWLNVCLDVMWSNPGVDLLGIEPRSNCPLPLPLKSTYLPRAMPTDHIGGIGLFRRSAFAGDLPQPNGRYGFTEWQWAHPKIGKAWIDPPLPVFLLDHLPREPWRCLGEGYRKKGWQRDPPQWGEYGEEWKGLWEWWQP